MNQKLRALLAVAGALTLGGVGYLVVKPQQGVTLAELADAGFTEFFDPVQLECAVRMATQCRTKPDGTLRPRYLTVKTKAWRAERNTGAPLLVFRWPRVQGQECFDLVGPAESACTVVTEDCTDAAICDANADGTQPVTVAQDRCVCRNPAAGLCRYTHPVTGVLTPVPLGVTWPPPVAGAGCVRKVCDETFERPAGQSWPVECPQ